MAYYLKQAWQLLKQNRFYSLIYIVGTGLSISMVMILAIVFYIKVANLYPESARDRLLMVRYGQVTTAEGNINSGRLSLHTVDVCMNSLQTAEAVTVVYDEWGDNFVQPAGSDEQLPVAVKYVDTGFWKVFAFSFVNGAPFTEADMQSGIRTAVVSASFARQLFGHTDVAGQYMQLNFDSYRICGVVKDVSFVANHTFAQVWIPYTANAGLEEAWEGSSYGSTLGNFLAYALAPSVKEAGKVREEIKENLHKYAASLGEGITFTVNEQPDRQWQSIFRFYGGQSINFAGLLWQYAGVFLVLLLVPAISLSGMADAQMERRLAEMGVRRAFGAPRHTLMNQLIAENLLFTGLGGVAGLLFSYVLLYAFRSWIIHIGIRQMFVDAAPAGLDVELAPSMLMNYTVFAVALVTCVVLNLLATVIPAWRTSCREIVYSLNKK
ncbi:MAG: ABC transporter permease [Tannerellaceae bacterium]|jgi:putative ABC transport system permease protein|nr:ABC transporter permease [Tannerellaceae bacterium]